MTTLQAGLTIEAEAGDAKNKQWVGDMRYFFASARRRRLFLFWAAVLLVAGLLVLPAYMDTVTDPAAAAGLELTQR